MNREKGGYVYIMASKSRRLYTGVTSELMIRVRQHKSKANPNSFTARYNMNQLVYYECFDSIIEAIARESRVKNMGRPDKIQLIVTMNSTWRDLSAGWGGPAPEFDDAKLRPQSTFSGTKTTEILASPESTNQNGLAGTALYMEWRCDGIPWLPSTATALRSSKRSLHGL